MTSRGDIKVRDIRNLSADRASACAHAYVATMHRGSSSLSDLLSCKLRRGCAGYCTASSLRAETRDQVVPSSRRTKGMLMRGMLHSVA